MSSMGITQIAAVMGSCVAGGAYLPIMCDESIIVKGTGSIFLAGSYLVKAAIGESVDNQTLGGAQVQTDMSGNIDYVAENDQDALEKIKKLMGQMGAVTKAGFHRDKPEVPSENPKEIFGILPHERQQPYDMMEIIKRLVDKSAFVPYKPGYGKTIITGYANIDGWAVGIIANQRLVSKNAKGEMQFGGVIYSESADKAARFVSVCNQKKIPLVFLQDVTGFMVGTKAEHGGIIKDGAKLVNAVSNSVVPKFTVLIGNSYGAGNYAMCGRAYDPRLMVSWPSAKMSVMGGEQAASVLLQIEKKGEKLSKQEESDLLKTIQEKYDKQTSPYYGAARLWTDAIIDPLETRNWISVGIEAANHAPITDSYKVGVMQV